MGRVRPPKRRVRDDDFCRRIVVGLSSDHNRIVFVFAETIPGFLACALQVRMSWQAQYLVKLGGDSCCSARCK